MLSLSAPESSAPKNHLPISKAHSITTQWHGHDLLNRRYPDDARPVNTRKFDLAELPCDL
jgi:hypothetical protein